MKHDVNHKAIDDTPTLSVEEFGKLLRERYHGPIVATDTIIEYLHPVNGDGIVLIERKFPPYGIAIPGGIAEEGLSLEDNAMKEGNEETGLIVSLYTPTHPLCVHSNPGRDPRTHVASVTYVGRGTGVLDTTIEHDDAKRVQHYTFPELEHIIDIQTFAFPSHHRALCIYLENRRTTRSAK